MLATERQTIQEYDMGDSSTWTVMPAPYVDPSFDRALIEIAGLNPHGEPMLVRRWGATYVNPQSATGKLKYLLANTAPTLCGFEYEENGRTVRVKKLEQVPPHILIPIPKYESHQLGERRHILEQWRSPEFLQRSGRFQEDLLHDNGDIEELRISCKNCGSHLLIRTGRGDEKECVECGSRRQSTVEYKEIKSERLLNDFPVKGYYDYFLRLQIEDGSANGLYRPCDRSVLDEVGRLWEFQQKSFAEQERLHDELMETKTTDYRHRFNEKWEAA